jgi:hypothetical protein
VFWRDTAAGMPTSAYFLAKWIADIPRIVLAAFMFSMAFILFVAQRAALWEIYVVILLLYINAFAMGTSSKSSFSYLLIFTLL